MRFPRVFFFLFLFISVPAFADCTAPAGVAGTMEYFAAPDNSFKFCNGTSWIGMSGASNVPAGAVIAFALTVCPAGWSEYTLARGRFLRGIDNGAGNDPDGTRAPGSLQADAFQSHWHTVVMTVAPDKPQIVPHLPGDAGGGLTGPANGGNPWTSLQARGLLSDGTNGVPRAANETRPENVAVLFCYKL
jgi:hypothetical protein